MLEAAHENDIELEGISLCLEIDGFLTNMLYLLCPVYFFGQHMLAVYLVGPSMMLPFSS
jgi:hypothetical protein